MKVSKQQGAINKLLEYPQYFREVYKEVFENGGCAILNAAIEVDDTHEELKELVTSQSKPGNQSCKNHRRREKATEIAVELNSSKYASIFIGTLEGGVMLSNVTGEIKYLTYALDHLESIILNQIRSKKEKI